MPVSHTHRQGTGTPPVSGNTTAYHHKREHERNYEPDIARIGQAIRDTGLSAPAAIALSAFRPLAWFGGQLLWVLQPFLAGMHGEWRRGHRHGLTTGTGAANMPSLPVLAELLEDEKSIDRLVEHLASASNAPDAPDAPVPDR